MWPKLGQKVTIANLSYPEIWSNDQIKSHGCSWCCEKLVSNSKFAIIPQKISCLTGYGHMEII